MLTGYCPRGRRPGPGVLPGPDGRVGPVPGGLVKEPLRRRRAEKRYGALIAVNRKTCSHPRRLCSSRRRRHITETLLFFLEGQQK